MPSIYVSFLAHRLLSDLFLTNVQSVNNNDIYGLSLKKKRVTKSIQIATEDLSIVKLGRSCLFLEFTHSNKFLTLFGCICTLHGGEKIWKMIIVIIFVFFAFRWAESTIGKYRSELSIISKEFVLFARNSPTKEISMITIWLQKQINWNI